MENISLGIPFKFPIIKLRALMWFRILKKISHLTNQLLLILAGLLIKKLLQKLNDIIKWIFNKYYILIKLFK